MAWIIGTWADDILVGTTFNDAIFGLAGNDTMSGGKGDDGLFGGAGNDYMYGGEGDDTLEGGNGEDSLFGGDGDDVIEGGAGADLIDGLSGNDTASYAGSSGTVWVTLNGGIGAFGDADGDVLYRIENLIGSAHADWLQGDIQANRIEGGGGNDFIQGLGGDDSLFGGDGDDRLEGGEGDDDLIGGAGNDKMFGGEGDDWFIPGLGDATVSGGDGTDTLDLRVFGDTTGWTVDARKGEASRLKPLWIAPLVMAAAGMDGEVQGWEPIGDGEFIWVPDPEPMDAGTTDRDAMEIATDGLWPFPNREMETEVDNEGFWPFPNREALSDPVLQKAFGDFGLDLPGFEDKPELFEPELGSGGFVPADLTWDIAFSDIENFVGSYGDDIIHGNELDNTIYGDAGDDQLFGHDGDDTIYSGSGEDSMDGGAGDDLLIAASEGDFASMTGGAGADAFHFISNSSHAGPRGEITDFEAGDRIIVDDANLLGGLDWRGSDAFTGQGPELRVVQAGGQAQMQVDRDGDGGADFHIDIVMQDAGYLLTEADFIL